jgi:hypothetical protein
LKAPDLRLVDLGRRDIGEIARHGTGGRSALPSLLGDAVRERRSPRPERLASRARRRTSPVLLPLAQYPQIRVEQALFLGTAALVLDQVA